MKKIIFIIIMFLTALLTTTIAYGQTAQQPSFVPSLIPITTNKYYLGSTTPDRKWAGIYITGSDGCLQLTSGLVNSSGVPCGSGGGGSGGGTFSTTTVNGLLTQYPYTTLITNLDGTATTTSDFWFDPFISKTFFSFGSSTAFTTGNLFVTSPSQGYNFIGSNGKLDTVSTSTLAGQVFPFSSFTGYNATSTVLGLLNGLFSTASSTFSGNLFLPALSQGLLYNGSSGLTRSTATTTLSTSGSGISLSGTPVILGSTPLTISNTGVTSVIAGSGISVSGATGDVTISATGGGSGGLGTTTPWNAGQVAMVVNNATVTGVSTSTPTIGSSLSYSGTMGNVLGGSSGTLNLNLANTNIWTGLQNFLNSSSTILSAGRAYFGQSATTTIDTAGNIVIPSGSQLTITGKSDGCATFSSGQLNSTGSACGSGGGGSAGGTWATTTSTVSGQLINYPNNNTDIVTVGANSTTSAKVYFDPNYSSGTTKLAVTNRGNVALATTTQNGGEVLDEVFAKSLMVDDMYLPCDIGSAVAVSADGNMTCGWYYAEDGAGGQISFIKPTGAGYTYGKVIDTTTGGGAGIFVPGDQTGWMGIATNTPILETNFRITDPTLATTTQYFIGFANINYAGTTFETVPTNFIGFIASSTQANWQMVTKNNTVILQTDTGIASSTNITSVGLFRRFRVEAGFDYAKFYIQSPSGAMTLLGTHTGTSVPDDVGDSLGTGVWFGRDSGGGNAGFDVYKSRFKAQLPLPIYVN